MAKAPRMKMDRQWQNIGANAYRSRIPLERILTGRPSIDALIREGWDRVDHAIPRALNRAGFEVIPND